MLQIMGALTPLLSNLTSHTHSGGKRSQCHINTHCRCEKRDTSCVATHSIYVHLQCMLSSKSWVWKWDLTEDKLEEKMHARTHTHRHTLAELRQTCTLGYRWWINTQQLPWLLWAGIGTEHTIPVGSYGKVNKEEGVVAVLVSVSMCVCVCVCVCVCGHLKWWTACRRTSGIYKYMCWLFSPVAL